MKTQGPSPVPLPFHLYRMSTMSGILQWNVKTTVIVVAASVGVLYILYAMLSGPDRSARDQPTLKLFHTWKIKEFVDVPQSVLDKMKDVIIDEHHVSVEVSDKV